MALESLAALLSGLKQLSPTLLLAIAIGSGVVLFSSDGIAGRLGIVALRDDYRTYLGGSFVASLALLIAHGCSRSARKIRKWWLTRRVIAERRKSLHKLTPDEKAYLIPYIAGSVNTQYFQLEDGVAAGLEVKGVLYRPSPMGRMVSGFAFNVQPWAREYLTLHADLLHGANPDPDGPPGLY
jgi:hypothetical protein